MGLVTRFTPPPLPEQEKAALVRPYSWTKSEIISILDAIAVYGSLSAALGALCPGVYESTLEEITSLGLSNATNSHSSKTRGLKGVSGYGRRMIRNGAHILEQAVGVRRCSLLTTTIPPLPEEIYKEVTREWAEIVRIFTQWIVRMLKRAHGYSWVVGCVEIQEERHEKEGGLPLHLHLVFQSRTKREFTIDLHEVSRVWQRAVCSRVPDAAGVNFSFATRIEGVKKSVAAYISKYISKGVNQNVLVSVEKGFKLPSAWWIGAGGIKQEIKRRTRYFTDERATQVWWMSQNAPHIFRYIYKVFIGQEGSETCIGVCGVMSQELRSFVCRSDLEDLQQLVNVASAQV